MSEWKHVPIIYYPRGTTEWQRVCDVCGDETFPCQAETLRAEARRALDVLDFSDTSEAPDAVMEAQQILSAALGEEAG